ncbi:hypothetical protein BH11VER1_BH11VER1_27810 [soil metagenome]
MSTCPVCGYPKLQEPPRSPSGGGSYEICPSCGFQFGVDDDDKGITFTQWRKTWVESGMPWSSRGQRKPENWDAKAQLKAVLKEKTVRKKVSKKAVKKSHKPDK